MSAKSIEPDFSEENGFFVLQLSKDDVGLGDEPVNYQGKTFQPKEEVHITIFGTRLGEAMAEAMADDPSLGAQIRAAIDDTKWSYDLHAEWYHVVDGDEETIIRMVGVPPLADFYRQAADLAGVEIPNRPTHVTMYTSNSPKGIGIATAEDFRQLVESELSPEYLEE